MVERHYPTHFMLSPSCPPLPTPNYFGVVTFFFVSFYHSQLLSSSLQTNIQDGHYMAAYTSVTVKSN